VDTVLLFVMYVLMSVVIQPSWLPNPIKLIIIGNDRAYCITKKLQLPEPARVAIVMSHGSVD